MRLVSVGNALGKSGERVCKGIPPPVCPGSLPGRNSRGGPPTPGERRAGHTDAAEYSLHETRHSALRRRPQANPGLRACVHVLKDWGDENAVVPVRRRVFRDVNRERIAGSQASGEIRLIGPLSFDACQSPPFHATPNEKQGGSCRGTFWRPNGYDKAMRPRRFHKIAWLLSALLLLSQALLPVSAVAFVSVRCAGVPVSLPACAEAMLPAPDSTAVGTRPAAMSCCLHMSSHCAMMGSLQAMPSAQAAVQATPPCVVSVSIAGSGQPAAVKSVRPWAFPAALALVSPAAMPPLRSSSPAAVLPPAPSCVLPPSRLADAHGLRAPPLS